MKIQMKTLLLACIIGLAISDSQYCLNKIDAANCREWTKCCDDDGYCADEQEDCEIYMNGHCVELSCKECCLMSRDRHFCGNKQECDDARTAATIAIIIIVIYLVILAIFCFWGIYLHYKVKKLTKKIDKESKEFDKKRSEDGGLIGKVVNVGQQVFNKIMK